MTTSSPGAKHSLFSGKEADWRALVENAPDIMLVLDREGIIQYANRVLPGMVYDDVVGSSAYLYIPAGHQDTMRQALARAFDSGHSQSYELVGQGANGLESWYSSRIGPVMENGEVVRAVLVTRDVTSEKKLLESIEDQNRSLEQFVINVSHDLREPLGTVIGFSELMAVHLGDALTEQIRKDIDFIIDAGLRMRDLISNLQEFARLGSPAAGVEVVALHAAVGEALNGLRAEIEKAGAEIEVGELPRVRGDQAMLQNIFRHLLSNAMLFREDTPRIKISARSIDAKVHQVSVADHGIGVDEEYREQIFLPLQRLNPRSKYPGTGMGLAIVRKSLELLGGRIWATETVDGGTTFHLTLPAA